MTRQVIATGSAANDGTGDTLRQAAQKINENFVEIYYRLGGDSNTLSSQITIEDSAIAFEGATPDGNEIRLVAANASSDRLIRLPDVSGFVVIDTASQTLTNKTLTSPSITTPNITTSINDANGNEAIKLTATGSAVNEITVINAATGNAPSISATGANTNINLSLVSKGTGSVTVDKVAMSAVEISANGAADATVSHIICNKGTALAVSLADGTTSGEYKVFTNKGAGIATVTPTNFAQGTSFALDQYDAATVIWDGTNWYITGHYGATVS